MNKGKTESSTTVKGKPQDGTAIKHHTLNEATLEKRKKYAAQRRDGKIRKAGSVDLIEIKKAREQKSKGSQKCDNERPDTIKKSETLQFGEKDADTYGDIQKVIEEAQEREERMHKKLETLQNQAKLALKERETHDEAEKAEGNKTVAHKLKRCERQLSSFKCTMDDILHMSKVTQNEIQKTKDIVSIIQSDTTQNKIYGSFNSKFVEDEDEEIFKEGSGCKISDIERPGLQSQQSQVIGSMEDDCISINN